MNSIPGREPRPDRSRYQSTQRNPQRGYYLALTFGTLLSSQGADAPKLQPRGLRLGRLSMLRRLRIGFTPGGSPTDLPARAAQTRLYTIRRTCAGPFAE